MSGQGMLGEHGPEAVIPLRGGRLFFAPVGTEPGDAGAWRDVGRLVDGDGIRFAPPVDSSPAVLTPVDVTLPRRQATVRFRLSLGTLHRLPLLFGPGMPRLGYVRRIRRQYRHKSRGGR